MEETKRYRVMAIIDEKLTYWINYEFLTDTAAKVTAETVKSVLGRRFKEGYSLKVVVVESVATETQSVIYEI